MPSAAVRAAQTAVGGEIGRGRGAEDQRDDPQKFGVILLTSPQMGTTIQGVMAQRLRIVLEGEGFEDGNIARALRRLRDSASADSTERRAAESAVLAALAQCHSVESTERADKLNLTIQHYTV